ncbi:MAG: CoA transferase [Rhodospirillaceae bacterium]|jgi:crotonobetainyl-CoA:carnitine CoA-transferase CaiB-like acyl-CoA transferase|nr:CoA transferase [Rhodospirillaceae bacterium]MBT5191740.1 CoA transferase [Rhodospirillaceae bacterium]MBT5896686.1 CoA transferase [Rhodospirillaceae bacterium]MBT6430636.1 CoA transferase [Rhodospirillaceae bacterium]MBT7759917.1 CoA transferase [Rhodospirillaceae bacterium]
MSSADAAGPLAGLRVIDLTRVLSGPFCTMTLGDMGAEVIKVENPSGGDDTRAFAPPYQGDQAAYFLSVNRNKKSLTLNLKEEGAKDVLWQLIDTADIIVENFRPGAAARLGFGYEAVAARRPEMIYASISGFGDTGPDATRPGYDLIVQGESSMMNITGAPDTPPFKMGTSIADMVSGMALVQGILAALYDRRVSNKGQHVKVSMLEALSALLTYHASNYFATGVSSERRGNAHPSIVPYETFEASDGWLNIAVGNDNQWGTFCQAIDRMDIKDHADYALAPDRVKNRDELIPLLADVLRQKSRDDWIAVLSDAGIPCGAIRTVGEICESETLKQRGMIWSMDHPSAGEVRNIANPIELTGTPFPKPSAPPRLGEHTDDVLRDVLGFSADKIAALKDQGAV